MATSVLLLKKSLRQRWSTLRCSKVLSHGSLDAFLQITVLCQCSCLTSFLNVMMSFPLLYRLTQFYLFIQKYFMFFFYQYITGRSWFLSGVYFLLQLFFFWSQGLIQNFITFGFLLSNNISSGYSSLVQVVGGQRYIRKKLYLYIYMYPPFAKFRSQLLIHTDRQLQMLISSKIVYSHQFQFKFFLFYDVYSLKVCICIVNICLKHITV